MPRFRPDQGVDQILPIHFSIASPAEKERGMQPVPEMLRIGMIQRGGQRRSVLRGGGSSRQRLEDEKSRNQEQKGSDDTHGFRRGGARQSRLRRSSTKMYFLMGEPGPLSMRRSPALAQ